MGCSLLFVTSFIAVAYVAVAVAVVVAVVAVAVVAIVAVAAAEVLELRSRPRKMNICGTAVADATESIHFKTKCLSLLASLTQSPANTHES